MGYNILFFGCTAVFTMARIWMDALTYLKKEGGTEGLLDKMYTFRDFNELMGMEEFSCLEERFKI